MQKVKSILEPVFQNIDSSFSDVRPLTKFCGKLNIRPAYILLPLFLVAVVSLGTGIFSHMFVAIVGMIYPAYMTYRALEANDGERCKQWLTYWIFFGFFTAFATTARHIFFFISVRTYNVFRLLFYVYLFHPSTRGAAMLYQHYVHGKLVQVSKVLQEGSPKQD